MNDLQFLTLDRLRELIREIVLEVLEQSPTKLNHDTERSHRQGWAEQFQAANHDDLGLLDHDHWPSTIWDETEWEW